jgi:hypothetical protein
VVVEFNYTATYARKQTKFYKGHWYENLPKSVETSQEGKVTILWNQQVQTDRTIPNNKLAIIICENKK